MSSLQGAAGIADILQTAAAMLEEAGIEAARIEAELLLGYCLDKSRTELYLCSDVQIDRVQREAFNEMIARRCRREPVAYIVGEREFWSQRFIVTPDVLIPRPETEFLVESVLQARKNHGDTDLCLDICCGSGVIAVILALETGCQVIATDISRPALRVCKKNCERMGVEHKVMLVQADLAAGLAPRPVFDLITANPPYVRRSEIAAELDPDVAAYEPLLALDGGEDGFDVIERIVVSLPFLLKPGGDFFMEIGQDQGARVRNSFSMPPFSGVYDTVRVLPDYAGRDRVVHVHRM